GGGGGGESPPVQGRGGRGVECDVMQTRICSPLVIVAAGGTGGHFSPAEALAVALSRRSVTVDLITDARASRYGQFPGHATHIVPSATFAGRDPIHLARAMIKPCPGPIRGPPL